MEIYEILRKLAEIQESGNKGEYGKFIPSLSLEELANLGGYAMALRESCESVAVNRILGGKENE